MRGSRPTSRTIAVLCLLLGTFALAGASAQGAAFPGGNGRIAYASTQNGNWDIYSMNADGSGKTRLTSGPGNDVEPSFSADGRRIVFASNRAGSYDIYAIDADGSDLTRLTADPANDRQPSFSPDGARVAFMSTRFGSWYPDLFLMNADGSAQTRVTTAGGIEESPTFSPDGQQIAFARMQGTHKNIFLIGATGGEPVLVAKSSADDRQPSFSPDGKRIAFSSRRDGHFEIYSMSATGTGVTKLTAKPVSQMPAYSPNGKRIAFNRGGSIYTMAADGSNEIRLTREKGAQAWPTWQPLPAGQGGGGRGGSSALRIGRPILDKRHGTARLPVHVGSAGTLSLRGKGIAPLSGKRVAAGVTVKLTVKPKRKLSNSLKRSGKATVKVTVTLVPQGGGAEAATKKLVLRRKR